MCCDGQYILGPEEGHHDVLWQLQADLRNGVLLDTYAEDVTAAADAVFATKFRERYPSLDALVGGTVLKWLHFAHLGAITDTPSSWVLALANCPYDGFLVSLVRDMYPEVKDVLANVASFLELCGTRIAVDALGKCLAELHAETAPYLDWHINGDREHEFCRLENWLRGGWKKASGTISRQFDWLDETKPVPWARVLEAENVMSDRFPGDLRRILFRVGDVGMALFGHPCLDPRKNNGQWPTSTRERLPVDVRKVGPQRNHVGCW